jgi:protein SCO1/2
MIFMNNLNYFCVLLLILAAGCKPKSAAPNAGGPSARTYAAHGVIRQIAADQRTVTIQHETIPGYMSAMTMDFPLKDTNELNRLAPGDEITFKLVVRENDDWIKDVHLVAHHIENVTSNVFVFHVASAELKPGDLLPDGELTDENGSRIHLSDFRGRALAFTFFFSRCPLPDFCPRMNKDFAEARQLLLNRPDAPANWQFLSISFDPEFDQPSVLSSYADFYRGADTNRWLFAAAPANTLAELAPRLDLMVRRDGAGISHNLRTVVLDAQGRIADQFDGNTWTPQELADAIVKAARPPANSPPP